MLGEVKKQFGKLDILVSNARRSSVLSKPVG